MLQDRLLEHGAGCRAPEGHELAGFTSPFEFLELWIRDVEQTEFDQGQLPKRALGLGQAAGGLFGTPGGHVIELGPVEFGAIDREKWLTLGDFLAGVIDVQLFDPSFAPDVDVERPGFVGPDDSHRADAHPQRRLLHSSDR